jgi:hypothetical protein
VVVVDDEDGWRLERFMNSDLFETCDGTNHWLWLLYFLFCSNVLLPKLFVFDVDDDGKDSKFIKAAISTIFNENKSNTIQLFDNTLILYLFPLSLVGKFILKKEKEKKFEV